MKQNVLFLWCKLCGSQTLDIDDACLSLWIKRVYVFLGFDFIDRVRSNSYYNCEQNAYRITSSASRGTKPKKRSK